MFTLSPSQPNNYLCYSGTLRRRWRPWWVMSYFVWFWNSKLYFIESLSLGGLNHHWRIQHWEDLICHWVSPLISWLLIFWQWFVPVTVTHFITCHTPTVIPHFHTSLLDEFTPHLFPHHFLSPLTCCYIYSLPPQLWQLLHLLTESAHTRLLSLSQGPETSKVHTSA